MISLTISFLQFCKKKLHTTCVAASTLVFTLISSCSDPIVFEAPTATPQNVFNAMWTYCNETFSFFELKKVNWQEVRSRYERRITPTMSDRELFTVCAELLNELRDGHSNLSNGDSIHFYDVRRGYDVVHDWRVAWRYVSNRRVLNDNLLFGTISDSIGYAYYAGFNNGADWLEALRFFKERQVKKIILDIRTNPGGAPQIAIDLAGHFLQSRTLVGFMVQKTGKGANDFSERLSLFTTPREPNFAPSIPVNVLINRGTYSAGSYMAGIFSLIPQVRLIGQITGGGGGGQLAYELPNKWTMAVSCNYFLTPSGAHIEEGVEPRFRVNNTHAQIANGVDTMLEEAIRR